MEFLAGMYVLILIGQCMSLTNGQFESNSQAVDNLTLQPSTVLMSNPVQCEARLSTDSERILKRLILEENKQLVYLYLNNTLFNKRFVSNATQILFPSIWVWATNEAGLPLLELDRNFAVYSLGTLSLDVGEMNVNIEIQNETEIHDNGELLSVISCIQERIVQLVDEASHAQSSLCHSQQYKNNPICYPIVQYKCCNIYTHKNNIVEGQRSDETCKVIKGDSFFYLPFFYVTFFLLLLFCPLFLTTLRLEDDFRAITTDGGASIDVTNGTIERPTEPGVSEPEEGRSMLYVIFNSSTPLSYQFKDVSNWIYRFGCFCFWALFLSSLIYFALPMGMGLETVSNIFPFVSPGLNIKLFVEAIILKDWRYLINCFIFIIITTTAWTILVEDHRERTLKTLTKGSNYLGSMKLPQNLCSQNETWSGLLKLYRKINCRAFLIFRKEFREFWRTEVFNAFTGQTWLKCFCSGLLKLIPCLFSLLWLIPLVNLIPSWGDAKVSYRANKTCFHVISVFVVNTCIIAILTWPCSELTKYIFHTIIGTGKHYQKTLPVMTIIVAALCYFGGTIHAIMLQYNNMTKVTFEECIYLQEQIDDGIIPRNAKFNLVVKQADGIPMIPKTLYDQVIEKHLSLRKSVMFALLKVCVLGFFLAHMAVTFKAFHMDINVTAGEAIAPFFLLNLPQVFVLFDGDGGINDMCFKLKVKETIKTFIENQRVQN